MMYRIKRNRNEMESYYREGTPQYAIANDTYPCISRRFDMALLLQDKLVHSGFDVPIAATSYGSSLFGIKCRRIMDPVEEFQLEASLVKSYEVDIDDVEDVIRSKRHMVYPFLSIREIIEIAFNDGYVSLVNPKHIVPIAEVVTSFLESVSDIGTSVHKTDYHDEELVELCYFFKDSLSIALNSYNNNNYTADNGLNLFKGGYGAMRRMTSGSGAKTAIVNGNLPNYGKGRIKVVPITVTTGYEPIIEKEIVTKSTTRADIPTDTVQQRLAARLNSMSALQADIPTVTTDKYTGNVGTGMLEPVDTYKVGK